MKLIIAFLIITTPFFAQTWAWAKSVGHPNCCNHPMAAGNQGNIFILSNAGNNTVELTQYDSTGLLIWKKASSSFKDVFAFSDNSILVRADVTEPSVTIEGITVPAWSHFFANIDAQGNVLSHAIFSSHNIQSISIDKLDNIYVAGTLTGTIVINSDTIVSIGLPKRLIFKLNKSGKLQWKYLFDLNCEPMYKIAATSSNEIFIGGRFSGDTLLYNQLPVMTTVSHKADFVLKIDSAGKYLWGYPIHGGYSGVSLDLDSAGQLLLSGDFFNQMTISNTALTYSCQDAQNPYCIQRYISKISGTGAIQWITHVGKSNGLGSVKSIFIDDGKVLLTGEMLYKLFFNKDSIWYNHLDPWFTWSPTWQPFIALLDNKGNLIWYYIPKCHVGAPTNIVAASGSIAFWNGFAKRIAIGKDTIGHDNSNGHLILAKLFLKGSVITGFNQTDKNQLNELVVFPNPSSKNLTISNVSLPFDATLYDLTGRRIFSRNHCVSNELVLPEILPGAYMLQIQSSSHFYKKIHYINR